jgi:hypothetical protein
MGAWAAWQDGVRRVNRAPAMLVGLFLLTLFVALPLSIALSGMIEAQLGGSLVAETLATGASYDWWQEFSAQASGLGTTFVPSIIGFGAVLNNLDAILDNLPMATTIAGATGAWLVLWSFLSGGVLDRYARQRPTRAYGFFAACGTHFWRFLRLGIVAWIVYWVLFAEVHVWLFDNVYPWLTRDLTVERTAFAIRLVLYLIFGLVLITANIIFDYARIRIVVEDRHSALGALVAGARFVLRQRGALALYALNALTFVLLVLVYALLAPGVRTGFGFWITFAIAELYILARHYVKLLFYASQASFFQGALAHVDYTAPPAVVWPDSPAAEAIGNSVGRRS